MTLFYLSRLVQKDYKENLEGMDSLMVSLVSNFVFSNIHPLKYNLLGDRGDAGLPGDKGYPGIGFNITGPPG